MGLTGLVGDFRTFSRFKPGTALHIDELFPILMAPPQQSGTIDEPWFLAADGSGYFPTDEGVEWVITRGHDNPILQQLYHQRNDAYWQEAPWRECESDPGDPRAFRVSRIHFPGFVDSQGARDAEDSLKIPMQALRLVDRSGGGKGLLVNLADGYVQIPQGHPEYLPPNRYEQQVMDRLGLTEQVRSYMGRGATTLTISFPDPAAVKREVEHHAYADSVWYSCWVMEDGLVDVGVQRIGPFTETMYAWGEEL